MSEEIFSLYHNGIKNTIPNGNIDINKFLEMIKIDNNLIFQIRNEEDKEKRNELKAKLSYVTFGGTFKKRGNDELLKSSGLICLDYDDIDNLEEVKEKLKGDNFVYCFFVSPSGNGLKVIVKIPQVKDNEEYQQYWNSVSKYFKIVKVDKGTKDISRACYMSVDKNPYFNPDSEVYTDKIQEVITTTDTTEEKETDTSRSGKEFAEVCRLIKKKKKKEQIWEEMKAFKRWTEKPESYRERTYENALEKVKEEKDKYITYTSFFEHDKCIYEEFLDDEKRVGFIEYNTETGTMRKINQITVKSPVGKELTYKPIPDEEVFRKYVKLPSTATEYGSDEKLEEDMKAFITKYLDVGEEHTQYGVWGTKQSWVYDRLNTINYLRALGDTGFGKTRYLNVIGGLHYKPISTSGATTSAPIFRIIKKWKGTMIIDEFDLKISDETADIIKIINLGFEKGKPILRCDKNNPNKVDWFDPYCPKVMASRKPFEDKATESRCFTKVMEETEREDIPVILTKEFEEEQQVLRNKLLLWRFRNYKKTDTRNITNIDLGKLEPRIKQAHMGFLPLFAHNKTQLEKFKVYLQEYQEDLISERRESFEGTIITALCELIFDEKEKDIATIDIIAKGGFVNPKNPKLPMNPQSLQKYLKTLGLYKRDVRLIDGKAKRCIVFNTKQMMKMANRYGIEINEQEVLE